jgi:integrase
MATTRGEQPLEEEDVSLADAVEGFTKQRVELVQRSAGEWIRALRDLTARNDLLRYRDLKAGTLDFQCASDTAVASLLRGRTVRLSALFPELEAREAARRRLRTINAKARENLEERGVRTLTIACGLSTWENKGAAWEPCAPVLLRHAELKPLGAAQDDFELTLTEEMELNPTLVHLLKADFDCALDSDSMLDHVDGTIDEPRKLEATKGTPLDGSKVSKRFKAACVEAGVRSVRFHDLRHTFATRLAASGTPVRTIQDFLGHADSKTTQIYAHYAPSAHEVRLVDRAFAPGGTSTARA